MSAPKQLFVLRHAKSSWDDPGLEDHERPLAPRGRRAVKLLNEYLRRHEIEPAEVLCSPARRTVETYDGVAPAGELHLEPELYLASGDDVLERLRRVPAPTPSVMVIGHNPAMQVLILRLTGANGTSKTLGDYATQARLGEVERKFPTGALATLTFDGPWSALAPGSAELVDLVRPRDLH
jgi:phosphohistidine phosphatase